MNSLGPIDALVFDVIGTVVDERGTVRAEVARALRTIGVDDPERVAGLADRWTELLDEAVRSVSQGRASWRSNDDLHRSSLVDALSERPELELRPADLEHLALVGHRLRPWPDSPAAVRRLGERRKTVALSNGDPEQLADMFSSGGLVFSTVLSASAVRSYKPDPAVYPLAIDRAELDPERTVFVACHPWDLRAAAQFSFRTAYVARAGEALPADDDHFDLIASDLADLERQLSR